MKIAVIFLAIIVLAFTLPAITGALFDFRTDSFTESFIETTAAAESNVTIQLAEPLWDGSVAYAAVSSNDTSEVPQPYSYNETTRALLVNGLNASTARLLTVTYSSGGLDDYTGAETGVVNIPTAIVVSIIILPLGLIVAYFFKNR